MAAGGSEGLCATVKIDRMEHGAALIPESLLELATAADVYWLKERH